MEEESKRNGDHHHVRDGPDKGKVCHYKDAHDGPCISAEWARQSAIDLAYANHQLFSLRSLDIWLSREEK